jgi:hypothetical protein
MAGAVDDPERDDRGVSDCADYQQWRPAARRLRRNPGGFLSTASLPAWRAQRRPATNWLAWCDAVCAACFPS